MGGEEQATARRPSRGRLERALRASAAWQQAARLDELAQLVCRSLRELIRCDAAGWNEIDLEGRTVRVHADPALEYPHDALERLIDTHPLVRHGLRTRDLRALTISDVLDEDAFHATPLYRQLYGPIGVEDQLAAAIELESSGIVAVALNRGARTFTDADRALLDLLRPHIAAAYAHVLYRLEAVERAAALDAGLEVAGQAIVLTAPDGSILEVPASARSLLELWFGRVPERVEPGEYEREHGVLRVSAVKRPAHVLLIEERRFALDRGRGRAFRLTPREQQVIALAGTGLSDRAIATRLLISERTVHKHLENVYAKLGVGGRDEAAALLRA